MKQVILAETAGFCFGVRRAVQLAERTAAMGQSCATLGPIIHNRHVVERLGELGVGIIDHPDEAEPGSRVIIRSHGVGREVLETLATRGVEIIDATCPDVKKIHRIIETADQAGDIVIVVGERDHPEVIAACGWCACPVVVETAAELEAWVLDGQCWGKPITAVFQTTYARGNMEAVREILKKWCTSAKLFDTICDATSKRQTEAARIAKRSDAMVVIGDERSANSRNLAAICEEHCTQVAFIGSTSDLLPGQFDRADTVGIVAGASTPAWIIKEVYQTMSDEILKEETTEELQPTFEVEGAEEVEAAETAIMEDDSFEAMLEKSFKTIRTGEKVVGIVTSISPTEITVDLGTKQSGYIPVHELTEDPDVKVEDIVQVGAEVQCYVMRVNDVEGTVMLSKKRLDMGKHWDEIEAARENRTVVEGTVTEENKGGIVVRVKGIRVFVPASQTGIPRGEELSVLMNQKVKLRVTEVNQQRRRVVGSIRAVSGEARKEQAEKTWNEIENGKRYTGTVKSLTTYGAFVDIGGVDGMVHVSELSWARIKSPADVVKVGDPLDVYVLSFDKEKGKISLGHKDPNQNPWKTFTDKYEKGSVAKVKVVKLMAFGAFAEIVPGVDGLIHISQIADKRIGKPEEFLSEGQEVEVQIIDIDYEKKNVSLSIRALTDSAAGVPSDAEAFDEGGEDGAVVYDTDINKPEPEVEEIAVEEVVAEAPAVEEAPTEEPVAEEPVAEEPVAEEPVAEEPAAEEPPAEEPSAE